MNTGRDGTMPQSSTRTEKRRQNFGGLDDQSQLLAMDPLPKVSEQYPPGSGSSHNTVDNVNVFLTGYNELLAFEDSKAVVPQSGESNTTGTSSFDQQAPLLRLKGDTRSAASQSEHAVSHSEHALEALHIGYLSSFPGKESGAPNRSVHHDEASKDALGRQTEERIGWGMSTKPSLSTDLQNRYSYPGRQVPFIPSMDIDLSGLFEAPAASSWSRTKATSRPDARSMMNEDLKYVVAGIKLAADTTEASNRSMSPTPLHPSSVDSPVHLATQLRGGDSSSNKKTKTDGFQIQPPPHHQPR